MPNDTNPFITAVNEVFENADDVAQARRNYAEAVKAADEQYHGIMAAATQARELIGSKEREANETATRAKAAAKAAFHQAVGQDVNPTLERW